MDKLDKFKNQSLLLFSNFANLEILEIGNNRFIGSLASLKRCQKLAVLDISNTDIEEGLEYLPEATELRIDNDLIQPDQGVSKLRNQLVEFSFSLYSWRQAHPDLVAAALLDILDDNKKATLAKLREDLVWLDKMKQVYVDNNAKYDQFLTESLVQWNEELLEIQTKAKVEEVTTFITKLVQFTLKVREGLQTNNLVHRVKIQELAREITNFLQNNSAQINISPTDLKNFEDKISHWKFIFWNQDNIDGQEWDKIITDFTWMVKRTKELQQKGFLGLSLVNIQQAWQENWSDIPALLGIGVIILGFIWFFRWLNSSSKERKRK